MQVHSINSYSNRQKNQTKPNFRSRYSEISLKRMTSPYNGGNGGNISINMNEYIPRLYTLLKYLDEILPGQLAKIEKRDANVWGKTVKDGYNSIWLGNNRLYETIWDAGNTEVDLLEQALVRDKASVKRNIGCVDIIHMPRSVYEAEYWANRNKTAKDVIKDFSYIPKS